MNHLWHMKVDGEYVYSVYCAEQHLESMKNAFLLVHHPLNLPVTVDITFDKAGPDEYEVYEEDIQ